MEALRKAASEREFCVLLEMKPDRSFALPLELGGADPWTQLAALVRVCGGAWGS